MFGSLFVCLAFIAFACGTINTECGFSCGARGFKTDSQGKQICECVGCNVNIDLASCEKECRGRSAAIVVEEGGCPTCQCGCPAVDCRDTKCGESGLVKDQNGCVERICRCAVTCASKEVAQKQCKSCSGELVPDDSGCWNCKCNAVRTACDVHCTGDCGALGFALDEGGCPLKSCACRCAPTCKLDGCSELSVDKNGCPECKCKTPRSCTTTHAEHLKSCQHSCQEFKRDQFGCPTCECATRCEVNECTNDCGVRGHKRRPSGCLNARCECVCPKFVCDIAGCLEYNVDINGCKVCSCKRRRTCLQPTDCTVDCGEVGFVRDDLGCIKKGCHCRCPSIEERRVDCKQPDCAEFSVDSYGCSTCTCKRFFCSDYNCDKARDCGPVGYATDSKGCRYDDCRCNCPTAQEFRGKCKIEGCIEYHLNAYGCPVCSCKQFRCPAVLCEKACTYGFELDAQGCRRADCRCKCPHSIDSIKRSCPLAHCAEYEVDSANCPICKCRRFQCPSVNCITDGCNDLGGYMLDKYGCVKDICTCVCPVVSCDVFCPFGCEKDARGCKTCVCVSPPKQIEPTKSVELKCPILDCPAGFCKDGHLRLDKRGCPTCQCCSAERMARCPGLDCPVGFMYDGEGCPYCQCASEDQHCDCNCSHMKK